MDVVVFNGLRPRLLRHGAKDVGETAVGRCLALFGPSVRLRTAFTHWNVPRKCGLHGELFFFLPKERTDGPQEVG